MSTNSNSSVSFDQTDTRSHEMNSTIEQWIGDLVAGIDDAQASAEFQKYLDVQNSFHDYSYRNALLAKQQCHEASPHGRLPTLAGRVRLTFYLAVWESDDPETVRERLGRISGTEEEIIDILED